MMNASRILARASRTRGAASTQMLNSPRYAHQSYGNEQSGHPQGRDQENPKRHMEHPGPESPATKGSSDKTAKSNSNDSNQQAAPKIHEPKSAAEKNDPEVRKHNEEMRQRADRSANQLGEEDNKVDKKFWQGDVGDINKK